MKFHTILIHICTMQGLVSSSVLHPVQGAIACNNSVHLAHKRYNEVAYATTHNGQSFKESLVQNQDKTITEQLEAGIRALKIPLWYGCDMKGNAMVCACHGMSKSLLYDVYEEQFVKQVSWFMTYETETSYNLLPHKTVSASKGLCLHEDERNYRNEQTFVAVSEGGISWVAHHIEHKTHI